MISDEELVQAEGLTWERSVVLIVGQVKGFSILGGLWVQLVREVQDLNLEIHYYALLNREIG